MKLSREIYFSIRRNILKKLYSHNAFSKGHILYERLLHSVPKHLSGFVKDVLDELVRDDLVMLYGQTKHGYAYQLNIKKLKEIEQIIFESKDSDKN